MESTAQAAKTATAKPNHENMDSVDLKPHIDVSAETLATLAEIGQEINSSLNLDEVLAKTAELTRKLIDFEIFGVLLPEEGTNQLYFRFAIGHRPEVVEHWRIPWGEGITGTAAATGRAVRVSDVSKDPRYLNALDSVRSELAVPMMVAGRAVGVLDISSQHLDYFTLEQQYILTLLATRIASAVENARLYGRVRNQADTLLLLNEVGREANSFLDVQEVLRRAAELTKRLIDYQIFSILLYDEAEKVFRHRVTVKFGQSIQEKHAVPANEGIVGAAAELKRAVLVPDVSLDPRYLMINPETKSELAVPMLHKNRVIGVLDLESSQVNTFTQDHVQALSILAGNLAVSIENASLYEQLAREEARLERDLNAARRLQGALLPADPGPEFGLDIAARVVSSRELCGDIYDFLRYGPQELAIVLGDVSGKGSAAALYGAAAIGILRSIGPQKLAPAEMLRAMNQLIVERRIEGRFMTIAFATWHRGRKKLRIANAGQEQPILFHDGRCQRIKLEGFPLGLFDEVTYDEASLTLATGDVVVLYSDGITDTRNAANEFFDAARLCEFVSQNAQRSAADIADRILDDVEAFSGTAHAFDDRTLVVLKVL
jgi:sigma-B regulation protein RsbU (phosphoserine phosphatase)